MEEVKKLADAMVRATERLVAELADARRTISELRAAPADTAELAAARAANEELLEKNRALEQKYLTLEEKIKAVSSVLGANFVLGGGAASSSPPEPAGAKRRAEPTAGEPAGRAAGSLSGGASVEKRGRFVGVDEPQPPLNSAAGRPLAQIEVPHRARAWCLVKWALDAPSAPPARGTAPPEGAQKVELPANGEAQVLWRGKFDITSAKVSREQVTVNVVNGKVQMRVGGVNPTSVIVAGGAETVSVTKDEGPRECKHGDIIVINTEARFMVWAQ